MSFFIHSFPFTVPGGLRGILISNIPDQLRLPTCPAIERLGIRMNTHFRLVPRLRMCGATSPFMNLMFIGLCIIVIVEELKTNLMSLAIFFTSYVLRMFRTLIYPSSTASDCVVELPHLSSCSQFVVCWRFGGVGFGWWPTKSPTHNKLRTR